MRQKPLTELFPQNRCDQQVKSLKRFSSYLSASLNSCALTQYCRAGTVCGSMFTHDKSQVLTLAVVWLMTVLNTQLSCSPSSFVEMFTLSKLQQCEVDGVNYKCVRALCPLSPSECTLQHGWMDFCEVATEITGQDNKHRVFVQFLH